MKVYAPENNYKIDKIMFTSFVYGNNVKHVPVSFDYSNKAFVALYPEYRLPALETADGHFVFGQHSIMLSIAPPQQNSSQIQQWISLIETELQKSIGMLVLFDKGHNQITQEKKAQVLELLQKFLKMVDDKLKLRTFLIGNSMSIIDISIFFSCKAVQKHIEQKKAKLSHFKRWYTHIESIQPK